MRLDRYIILRHLGFYGNCKKNRDSKINSLVCGRLPSVGASYKPIDSVLTLHERGQLIANDRVLLFHTRYNNGPGTVYQTDQ